MTSSPHLLLKLNFVPDNNNTNSLVMFRKVMSTETFV